MTLDKYYYYHHSIIILTIILLALLAKIPLAKSELFIIIFRSVLLPQWRRFASVFCAPITLPLGAYSVLNIKRVSLVISINMTHHFLYFCRTNVSSWSWILRMYLLSSSQSKPMHYKVLLNHLPCAQLAALPLVRCYPFDLPRE